MFVCFIYDEMTENVHRIMRLVEFTHNTRDIQGGEATGDDVLEPYVCYMEFQGTDMVVKTWNDGVYNLWKSSETQ